MKSVREITDEMAEMSGDLDFYENQYTIIKNNIKSAEETINQLKMDLSFIKQNNDNWHEEFTKYMKKILKLQ